MRQGHPLTALTPLAPLMSALSLLLVVSGCSASTPSSPTAQPSVSASAPPSASATVARQTVPQVGQCYQMGWREVLSPTAPTTPVACRRRHQSVTFAVGRLDLARAGHLLAVDSDAASAQAARECRARLASWVGGEEQLRLSMLAPVWFTPTLTEADAGADWFRCDVVAVAGPRQRSAATGSRATAQTLMDLPSQLRGVLSEDATGPSPDRAEPFAMCGTASPDDRRFRRVSCSRPHSWRAVASVDLPGTSYPPKREAMDQPCEAAAKRAAADPLDFTWSQELPTRELWQSGRRYGLCWVRGD